MLLDSGGARTARRPGRTGAGQTPTGTLGAYRARVIAATPDTEGESRILEHPAAPARVQDAGIVWINRQAEHGQVRQALIDGIPRRAAVPTCEDAAPFGADIQHLRVTRVDDDARATACTECGQTSIDL